MNKKNIDIKKENYTTLFRLIKEKGPVSRRELEHLSQLSWGTVSAVTAELLRLGYIESFRDVHSHVGRTPDKLIINDKVNLCLGIDINILGLTFVVCDVSNKVHEIKTVDLYTNKKEDILRQLEENTRALTEKYKNIITISLSMQGQIDREKGVSVSAEHFSHWHDVEIKKFFEERFGVRTFLYHDPDCLMTYHYAVHREELKRYSACAVIKLDEGIGMSLVLDDKIYESKRGADSEIGHTCVNVKGAKCRCGKTGCLEAYCSLSGLADRYSGRYKTKVSANEFEKLLAERNAEAVELLDEKIKYLAIALANLSNIINPNLIIIDGVMSKYADLYIDKLKSILFANTENKVEIQVAEYKREAAALGAGFRTIDDILTDILFPEAA